MNRWDLSILYKGFDDPEYESDIKLLKGKIEDFKTLSETAKEKERVDFLKEYIKLSEEITSLLNDLFSFASLTYSADTRNAEASSNIGKLMGIDSEMASCSAKLSKEISEIDNLGQIIDEDTFLKDYKYFLMNIKRDSKYLLGDREEEVFAKLNISGAGAWSDLQSALTSSVKADYNGEKITLSQIRSLAYDKDAKVRREAYEAELKCYENIKEPVAFALNSIAHQVLSECRMRGYSSPLDKALKTSRMTRETLDALLSSMEEYMPVFRKYLKAKAKALGHKGGLPWYDLFAPLGKCDKTYTVEKAKEYLLDIFAKFDTELYDMVKCAFENNWIDFFPREGKVGGAFDSGVASKKQSRVLTNFTGSFSDIVTLAHELGHAFHDRQVFSHSVINQNYSMPVAETASTFNETLVMGTAIENATDKYEKLALIESQLSDACQIIVDIYSRFTFEKSVFENRPDEFMDAEKLSSLMLEAQDKSYGDGLCHEFRHKYMWLCKSHYYSGDLSFYNFPYAFGGLFARGLYEKYKEQGSSFVKTYKKLLFATSVCDVEETAQIAGIDLKDRAFWCRGLESMKREIDTFCELVEELY